MNRFMYTGKPGSGKSYLGVNDLLKPENQKKYILHNIDGLKNQLFKNPECVRDWRDFISEDLPEMEFFSEEYQTELCAEIARKYNRDVLLVVDEAHRWFNKTRKKPLAWLSYTRHLRQEVWLITQKDTMLHRDYRALIDLEFRAKNGFLFNIPFFFVYQKRSEKDGCGLRMIRKKKFVFMAYQSFMGDKPESRKTSLLIPGLLVFVALAIGFVWFRPTNVSAKPEPNPKMSKPVQGETVRRTSNPSPVRPKSQQAKERPFLDFRWIPVNYTLRGEDLRVVNPFSNQLEPVAIFPFELRVSGRDLYAKITSDYFALYDEIERGNENENRRGEFAANDV